VRRFVRSHLIKRLAQVTVVQDGTGRRFEVLVWRSEARELYLAAAYGYEPGRSFEARDNALAAAHELAKKIRRETGAGPYAQAQVQP
jgi:hypothetical protein